MCSLHSEGVALTPTQYKNHVNCVDSSHEDSNLGVVTDRHYFGSHQGKGPCEREIDVLKETIQKLVAARQVADN